MAKPRFGRDSDLEIKLKGVTFETTADTGPALKELEAGPIFVVRHYQSDQIGYSRERLKPGVKLDPNLESCRLSTQPLPSAPSPASSPLPTAWGISQQPLVQNGGSPWPTDPYFRAEAAFTLEPIGGKLSPIEVFCIRPYSAADQELIEFVKIALDKGLGLKPASPEAPQ